MSDGTQLTLWSLDEHDRWSSMPHAERARAYDAKRQQIRDAKWEAAP
jgi:hypothetical protein